VIVAVYGLVRIRQARSKPQNTAIEVGGALVGHG
jgi:hypothetical protein